MSEAEKQAVEAAVIKALTGIYLHVSDWLSGSYVKEVSDDGAGDIVKFVTANGWEFSRELPSDPVKQDVFVRKANGLPVSLSASASLNPLDLVVRRALEREGAEELWDTIADKKWYIGKATS